MIDAGSIRRIIVRLPNWVGDAVMAIPAVNSIKKCAPDAHLSLLGKRSVLPIYEHNSNVDELIRFEPPNRSNKLSSLRAFASDLVGRRFDLGFVLPDSFSSALVLKLGKVKERVGYRSELRSFLLTQPLHSPTQIVHRSNRYMHIVESAFDTSLSPETPTIAVSEREVALADRFLANIVPFAVVCPVSRAESRRWGETQYADLLCSLVSELRFSIVLAGAEDEAGAVERVGSISGVPFLNLAKIGDILTSVEVMRRSAVFVGNDSGAAHLAAAAGARVISISGADDPRQTRPLARAGKVVSKELWCSPCVKNVCPRKDHVNECMDVVSVCDVLSAVQDIVTSEE